MKTSLIKTWLTDTGLRAVKTGAQTAVALLGANTAGLTQVGWVNVLDVSALAMVVSVLHNLAGLKLDGGTVTAVTEPNSDSA